MTSSTSSPEYVDPAGLVGRPSEAVADERAEGSHSFDKIHGLLLFACVVMALLSVFFHRRAGGIQRELDETSAELQKKRRELNSQVQDSNRETLLTKAAATPVPIFRVPPEVQTAAAQLQRSVSARLEIVHATAGILEPHARQIKGVSELEVRLSAIRSVLDAARATDPTVAAINAANLLMTSPELASEGLRRELLNDLLRSQRRVGGISLDASRSLASALAAGCGTDYFEPQIGQLFDQSLHQAVGDSSTSGFREPVIKRVVSGGLRDPKSGHIRMRADVEIG